MKPYLLPEDVKLWTSADAVRLVEQVLTPRVKAYADRAYRWGSAEAVSAERAADEARAEAAAEFLDLLTAAFGAPERVVGRAQVPGRAA